jgi:hypothetical protein
VTTFKAERQARREATGEMLEHLYARRSRLVSTGEVAQMLRQILSTTIDKAGHADLSKVSDRRVEVLYRGLLHIAEVNGCYWRSAIDADTGRMVSEMLPGEVDPNVCAADLQYGYNTFGLPEEIAAMAAIVGSGGVVLQPCPDCERFERAHVLQIRRVDDQFIVVPA